MTQFPSDSTHFHNWIISSADLQAQKERVHREAEERVIQKHTEAGVANAKSIQLPTLAEAEELVSYFVAQLLFVCFEKRLEYRVTNTAAAFLSRFFLRRSVIEFDPRRVLLTCVLLAAKVEEASALSLRHFCDGLIPSRERLAEVVDNELVVLDALGFDLVILNARAPIHYLTTHYYQQHRTGGEGDVALGKQLADLNRQAEQMALRAYTDASIVFGFSPAHIAVACFLQAAGGELRDAEQFVEDLLNKNLEPLQRAALGKVMQDVRRRLILLAEAETRVAEGDRTNQALKTLKKIEKAMKPSTKRSPQGGKSKRVKRAEVTSSGDVPMDDASGTATIADTQQEPPAKKLCTE